MSTRCPKSRYLGRAILPGFRWQINTRGYANIVSSTGDYVEGLCYLLDQKDESRLDSNEGVPTAYVKETFPVDVFSTSALIVGRRCKEVSEHIYQPMSESDGYSEHIRQSSRKVPMGQDQPSQEQEATASSASGPEQSERVDALVYINWDKTDDGQPRAEYIDRINLGIADALKLGVSHQFVERYIRKYIRRTSEVRNGRSMAQLSGTQQVPAEVPDVAERMIARDGHYGATIVHSDGPGSNVQNGGNDASNNSPIER